jgi:uncharacterized protein
MERSERLVRVEPRVLAVFARCPMPGRVKTRLAAAIGAEGAARLYAAFLADLARALPDPRWALRWWVAPPADGFAAQLGVDPGACREQRGRDLGERMRCAFASARAEGFARCVLVGSDTPQLHAGVVAEAFGGLDEADVVLGPAEDGGYYLIGLREPHDVFRGVAWSTPTVLDRTLARVRSLALRLKLLATRFDVDEAADLDRLRTLLASPDGATAMPATAAVLATLGGPRVA